MNIILFDDNNRNNLLPLTYTRPIADLRVGILTIKEKWEQWTNNNAIQANINFKTQAYLSTVYPANYTNDNLLVNGAVLTNNELAQTIADLKEGENLYNGDVLIAARLNQQEAQNFDIATYNPNNKTQVENIEVLKISAPHDIFMLNDKALRNDFEMITYGRKSQPISDTNRVIGAENIFLEEGAIVECSNLNAKGGPIYIGKDAEVMEGCSVRGPFALCEHSQLKLNTKIYGPTTVGPHSKAGGEVTRSVIMGYSNKGHDGFLGDSVLGYWCNLGADTNNSNLKNNYAEVKLWDYPTQRFKKTGLQFCGLIMGDHSKCGINTMFNTGTVVGICANIFGAGFPRNFIPDFAWGGAQGYETNKTDKVFETAQLVYQRRGKTLSEDEKAILTEVFNQTAQFRFWEKA